MTDFLKMAREVGLNPQGAADQTRLTNAMARAYSAGHTAGYKLGSDLTAAQIEERNAAGLTGTVKLEGFDKYCAEHDIQPGEEPAAFGAYLHEMSGWDGKQSEVGN